MRFWVDGQCLQDAHCRVTCGFRVVDLLKRLLQADGGIDLYISLNAQWLDEALAARRYLNEHLPMANVQIWMGVSDSVFPLSRCLGVVSRKTPEYRLSSFALTHHINCLVPDIALLPNSFEENQNTDECLADSKSKIFILPELSLLSCVHVGIFCMGRLFIKSENNISSKNNLFDITIYESEKGDKLLKDNLEISAKDFCQSDDFLLREVIEYIKAKYHYKFGNKQSQKLNQEQIINLSRNSLKDNVSYGYSSDKIVSKLMTFSEPLQPRKPYLLFDATSTYLHNSHINTGIQRVVRKLSDQLNSLDKFRSEKICFYDQSTSEFKDIQKIPITPISEDIMIMLDSNWSITSYMQPTVMMFALRGVKIVYGIHDLIPLYFPGLFKSLLVKYFVKYFKFNLLYASSIVCISRAVADEVYALLRGIGFPYPMKIGFWQLGADMLNLPKSEHVNHSPKQTTDLMFLVVGTLEIRKGHSVVLEAFEELWHEGWNVELNFVGMKGWLTEHFIDKLRQHPELGTRLHWREHLDDHGLQEMYANADAMILASYAEGFGLPIAEAGHFGKPVIVSDIPVFREVSAAAPRAFFFAPGSAQDLAAKIRNFCREFRNGFTAQSKPPAWPSWAESMEQLRSVVLKDQYYKTYQPEVKQDPFAADYIGEIYTQSYLPPASQKYHLSLFDEPHKSKCKRFFNIRLFVKNMSDQIYASNQDFNYKLGIRLGARPVRKNNQVMGYGSIFADIPFVLLPGHQHVMGIAAPRPWWEHGAVAVEVDLLQVLPHGCHWWGQSPLHIALPSHIGESSQGLLCESSPTSGLID